MHDAVKMFRVRAIELNDKVKWKARPGLSCLALRARARLRYIDNRLSSPLQTILRGDSSPRVIFKAIFDARNF